MKRLQLILFFSIIHLLSAHSENIAKVFSSMPDSLLPLLTEKNRHDMLDFYNNHMEAKVRNRLNDYVQLDTLTEDFLHLTLSKVSTLEMKMLMTTDSVPIIVLVRTIGAPAQDSHVTFYNHDWQQLQWLHLPDSDTEDFFSDVPDSVRMDMSLVQRSIDDLRLVKASLSPEESVITLQVSVEELARDEKQIARRYLVPVRYRWTGREFVKE